MYDGSVTIGTEMDTSGAEKGLKSLGKLVASSALVAAIAKLGKASLDAFADYEQLVGGVDTLFKESSKSLQEYAANAYKTAGLSANQYMATVTSFSASLIQSLNGDTKSAVNYADQAVTDMADNANKFGTTMEAIQNAYQGFAKQNYTMLDNLKLGYGGTKEEMERLLEDAEKLSGLEFDISSFADVTQAIHIIQESMGVAGATAEEAEHTISGSISALTAAWGNFLTGMADSNADLGKLGADVVKQFKVVAKNVLPVIGQIADNIPGVKQLKALLPVIVSIGAAFAAWKVVSIVSGITNAFRGAQTALAGFSAIQSAANLKQLMLNTNLTVSGVLYGVLAGEISIATAAQAAFNVVAAAAGGPVGLAIIAVTALGAGLVALAIKLKKTDEDAVALTEAMDKMNESVDAANATYNESVTSTEANAIAANRLVAELEKLEAQESMTTAEQARYKQIVEQINQILPETNAQIDAQTGLLIGGTAALRENIEVLKEQFLLQARIARNTDLLNAWAEAALALEDAEAAWAGKSDFEDKMAQLAKLTGVSEDMLRQWISTGAHMDAGMAALAGVTGETAGEVDSLAQSMYLAYLEEAGLIDAYYEAEAALAELNAQVDEGITGLESQTDATDAAAEADRQLAADIANLAAQYGVAESEIQAFVSSGGSLDEWVARQDAAVAQAEAILDRLVDAYYNMNERIKASDDKSLADRNANIEANQAAVDAYAANLDAIAAKAGEKGVEINDRLWDELQSGTPESMDLAADILASMELDDGQWSQLNDNFNKGMEGTLSSVAGNLQMDGANNPAQAALDEMVLTLNSDTSVETATEHVIEDALRAGTARVAAIDFTQLGTNMMKGIENGIRNGTSGIVAAINEAVTRAHEAAKKIDQQHSPSKWWEKFGLNDMKGFAMGIEGGAKLVNQAQADVLRGLQQQMVPAYAGDGISPGYGSVVNHYTQVVNTHDSLSPFELTQEFDAFKAREGWQRP